MKNKRFFLCKDTLSTIALEVPNDRWESDYEVTMRDCSRQIHWLFTPNAAGVRKAKKVAEFWTKFAEELQVATLKKRSKA